MIFKLHKWWKTLLPYFWHLHYQFWHVSKANGMYFQCCSVPFRNAIDLQLSYLSQTKHPDTIKYAKVLHNWTLPFKFQKLLVWLWKTLTTIFITWKVFLPRLIRPLENLPTKLSLSGKSFIFSQRNTRNWYIDTRHTGLRHFDSPSNPCAAN